MKWLMWRKFYYGFSLILIALGALAVVLHGLQPSIEFTGGSQLTLAADRSSNDVRAELEKNASTALGAPVTVQYIAPNYQLTMHALTNSEKDDLIKKLQKESLQLTEVSFQSVGPTVGKELLLKTVVAIGLSILVILFYVWYRFRDWKFGLAAVLAMVHDVLIVIGTYAWFGKLFHAQLDTLFVTAVLTVISFSIHDTIVLFGRLKDLQKQNLRASLEELGNQATTLTLNRSLNNSLMIVIMLLSLLLIGGDCLRWFTGVLLVGTLVGTYSSTFVALPLLIEVRGL